MEQQSEFFTIKVMSWKPGKAKSSEPLLTSPRITEAPFSVKVPLVGKRCLVIPFERMPGAPAQWFSPATPDPLPDVWPEKVVIPDWDPVFVTCLQLGEGNGFVIAFHGVPHRGQALLDDFQSQQTLGYYLELQPESTPA